MESVVPEVEVSAVAGGDAGLRRRVFWGVLLGALAFVAANHLVVGLMRYDLSAEQGIEHGSYGFGLGRAPAAEPGTGRVAVLGNSVYQSSDIVGRMQALADQDAARLGPVRLTNRAQTGSGVSDFVVQAAVALEDEPDLLVVCMAWTASRDRDPAFRTDTHLQAMHPGVRGHLPASFVDRKLDREMQTDAAIAYVLPGVELDPIFRNRARKLLDDVLPRPCVQQLGMPTLNLAADWRQDEGAVGPGEPRSGPVEAPLYADYQETLAELVGMARAAGVPLVIIWQESDSPPVSREVFAALQRLCAQSDEAWVVDLESYHDPERYADTIHPWPMEYDATAGRHYQAIATTIETLRARDAWP